MQCPEVIFVFIIYYKFCWVRNTCLRASQFSPHYTARKRLHKDCSRHIRFYPLKLYFHTNFYLYLAIWCLHFTIVLLNFVLLLALLSDYQAVQSTHIKFSLPHPFFLQIIYHNSLVHTHRGKSENKGLLTRVNRCRWPGRTLRDLGSMTKIDQKATPW